MENRIAYTLFIRGIFGRNRKPKFESFELGETIAPLELNELKNLVDLKLGQLRPKSPCWYKATSLDVSYENDNGFQIKTCKPLGAITLIEGTTP